MPAAWLPHQDREHALMPWPFGWVKSWRYEDGSFVENCRIGVFLFVFVRLLSAVLTLVVGVRHPPDPHSTPSAHAAMQACHAPRPAWLSLTLWFGCGVGSTWCLPTAPTSATCGAP